VTLRLILTRHAKSSWDDPLLDDVDRTLNDRGEASADAIGAWLAQRGHVPDAALVSAARRTRETWERMAAALPPGIPVRFEDRLYHAGPDTILKVLRTADAPVVLLIGHNPGLAEFAGRIVAAAPRHPRFADYPTAATAVIDFDAARWADVGWHRGQVADFVVPRDLIG
jgi:phosphohistidine phosphatase